ncbi:MAG: hypothetical protein AB7N73_14240 [Gemmatimonadales bacterium]|nr:hypothetical protein [Gemmatimonadales bacterium]HRX19145.1 hypothetical protein [Gemmatimonadales bacterium]
MSTPSTPEAHARYRRTAVRVFTVQVVTLLLLWWLQATFAS